jgi:CheY-like chemotaxis protein
MSQTYGPILIIEDIPSVRELLEATLRYKGYQVITAANGIDALELVKKELPSLIITDILMPKMDGFALAQQLRTEYRTRKIPIIIISATYIASEDKDFALKLGIARFIEKPIDTEDFSLTVAEVLTEGRKVTTAPLPQRDFNLGYRERLDNKLRYKLSQINRIERLLRSLPEGQRQSFEQMLAEAEADRDTIQAELNTLYNLTTLPQNLKTRPLTPKS